MGLGMDLNIIKQNGCEGIITDNFSVIYDEVELAISSGNNYVMFKLDEIHRLRKAIEQAETAMLENYKSMNLTEKNGYCKKYDIKYSTLQQIITLRSENDGKE